MKYNLLVILILLLHSLHVNGMKPKVKKEKKPIAITFFQLNPPPRIFHKNIPSEIQGKVLDITIFNAPSATLKKSIQLIRDLSMISKEIYTYIDVNTLSLIKCLSTKFKLSNEVVAKSLQTKTADGILFKQQHFAIMCTPTTWAEPWISAEGAIRIRKHNIDINFTYGNDISTQLIFACSAERNSRKNKKSDLIEWLVENKADINIENSSGITAPLEAACLWYDGEGTQPIEYFWDHPDLNINEIRWNGYKKTLLMQVLFFWKRVVSEYCYHNLPHHEREKVEQREERQGLCRLKQVQELCNRGADPECGHTSKSRGLCSAWTMAQESGDKDLIKILEEAIAKKHVS